MRSATQVRPRPEQVASKALARAADLLGLTQAEVAQVLGTSLSSVSRTFAGARALDLDSAAGRNALLFVRVFRSLDALLGGDSARARRWLSAANDHLAGSAPKALLMTTHGLVHLADYLDAMRGTL
ncbi:MAG: MbcA/ParS/Xre antitoxin family protein [Myxococcales bacterium]